MRFGASGDRPPRPFAPAAPLRPRRARPPQHNPTPCPTPRLLLRRARPPSTAPLSVCCAPSPSAVREKGAQRRVKGRSGRKRAQRTDPGSAASRHARRRPAMRDDRRGGGAGRARRAPPAPSRGRPAGRERPNRPGAPPRRAPPPSSGFAVAGAPARWCAWGSWDDSGRAVVQICCKGAPRPDRPREEARNINDPPPASRLDRGLCNRFGQPAPSRAPGGVAMGRTATTTGAPTTARGPRTAAPTRDLARPICRRPGQRVGASAPSTGKPPGSAAFAPDPRTRRIGGDGPLG